MIDFDVQETIPRNTVDLLSNHKDDLKREIRLQTERNSQGHKWYGQKIEMHSYDFCTSEIKRLLINQEIQVYQCTKLLDPYEVLVTGLKPIDRKKYRKGLMVFFYSKIEDHDLLNQIENCFDEAEKDDDSYSKMENKISFLINKSLIKSSGCREFFQYYGGEAIRTILYGLKEKIYPLLMKNGIPCIVSFSVKFHELEIGQQCDLIKELIHSQVFDFQDKEYRSMGCEGSIKKIVEPKDIIKVISNKDFRKLIKHCYNNNRNLD
jgi:hypothetical protein